MMVVFRRDTDNGQESVELARWGNTIAIVNRIEDGGCLVYEVQIEMTADEACDLAADLLAAAAWGGRG